MINKGSSSFGRLVGAPSAGARTSGMFPDIGANGNNPTTLRATGGTTLRRLAEPVQSDPDDEIVEPGIQGGANGVIAELERQAAELEQMRRQDAHADEPSDAADDIDYQYLRSMMDTDPHKVMRVLIEYLKGT